MYKEIAETIAKFNTEAGLDAETIAKQAKEMFNKVKNRYQQVIFTTCGQYKVAYSNDYKALLGLVNASKNLARQATEHIRKGKSYGIPNCVTDVIDHDKWVTNGMPYKNPSVQRTVRQNIRKYCVIWGQSVQNNFLEYYKGYKQIHTQAQKRKIWNGVEGV
jgi:uncharacterized protein (DUF885 family)